MTKFYGLDGWSILSLGVNRFPLVADLGDEAELVVSGVGGRLDPAVRERNHELALHVAAGVLAL